MNLADKNFKELCKKILDEGFNTIGENVRPKYADGTPSHTFFTTQVFDEYDISKNEFPITTLRPIAWKSAIKEILWIYQDQSNDLNLLKDKYGITWWDEWEVDNTRTIGQRYGATIKKYDLMNKLLDGLETQPFGRRHIINLYQYDDFNKTSGLYPCAMETHWSVRGDFLDLTLIQRSSDLAMANSINKIQYVALQMMVAQHLKLKSGKFCHLVQNAHIYDRHVEAIREMLERPGQDDAEKIVLKLNSEKTNFYDFTIDDFTLLNYNPNKPNFKLEIAI